MQVCVCSFVIAKKVTNTRFTCTTNLMDAIYGGDGANALGLDDLRVSDDHSSVLLTDTNKLLNSVGISAKKIVSTEELSRVASSLFVAVYESLFHQKISGVVRNPKSTEDYERNAQLVIDSLSDQIQLDLKHITGRSIVSGDLRVLSNLVHILLRIVSLTSQESLTSYDSVEDGNEGKKMKYRAFLGQGEAGGSQQDNESLSTRESEQPAAPRDPYYIADAARFRGQRGTGALPVNENANSAFGAHNGIVFNEDLRRSLARMEHLMQSEQKISAARRRREGHLSVRESASRASNLKHAQTSRAALQRKWADDADRERKAFALKTASAEQVLLSKIYKGLLKRVVQWKLDEQKEERAKRAQIKEQTTWQAQSMQELFEERVRALREALDEVRGVDGAVSKSATDSGAVRQELALAEDLLRSVAGKNRALLEKERARLQHQRDRELLRRREAHEALLAMLNVADWKDMLRRSPAAV